MKASRLLPRPAFAGPGVAAVVLLGLVIGCQAEEPTQADTTMDEREQVSASVSIDSQYEPRANRTVQATDAAGHQYSVSYQPDWASRVAVSKVVAGQSVTSTLYDATTFKQQPPGPKVWTRIASPAEHVDFGIMVDDPNAIITRVIVEVEQPETGQPIRYEIEERLPPPGCDDPNCEET